MEKGIPWFEQKTGLEVMQWLDPDRLIEWVRSHWQQAGGVATTFMGYVSRSGFAMVTWGSTSCCCRSWRSTSCATGTSWSSGWPR